MPRVFTIVVISILFFCCKNSNTVNKPLNVNDFLKLYKPLKLPLNISDTGLINFGDTSSISYSILIQFIPDFAVAAVLKGETSKYIIQPAGLIHFKTNDYLITKFTSGKTIKMVVFVLDDKHDYKTFMLLLNNHNNNKYNYSVSITNEPTFIIKRDQKGKDNTVLYSRNGYAFNASTNTFTEVMNDSNEDKVSEVINPIDTLSKLNKFSSDYVTDRKNFISIRDGKNPQTYIFFIHFEKNKGECIGELKGEMNLTDATHAEFKESGDPCVIHFKFTAGNIKVNEEGNCGNHRGINCPFDFNFKKQKNK